MTDICLMRYQCTICKCYFWGYTECKKFKYYNKALSFYDFGVITAHGTFRMENISFPENSDMPMIEGLSIKGERECAECRSTYRLDDFT